MKISAYAAGVAVVLCLVVAGCSSSDGPGGSSPREKPSPTVTTEAPPAPPELPAAATKKTAAGAEAFVKYYWAVVDYSQRSGDTRVLESLSTSTCAACTSGINNIADVFENGGVFKVAPTKLSTSTSAMTDQHGISIVTVFSHVHSPGGRLDYGPGDDRNIRQDPVTSDLAIVCAWSTKRDAWLVNALTGYRP